MVEYEDEGEGATVPFRFKGMIEREIVKRLAEEQLAFSDCYLVDVTIKPGNLIVVEIDHDKAVGIDDCVSLSRYIEERIDRNIEDYELEVGSSGIGSPLKIVRQYVKNIGNEMEVLLKSGIKLRGELKAADENGITIAIGGGSRGSRGNGEARGSDGDQSYTYGEIKNTKNIIRFK